MRNKDEESEEQKEMRRRMLNGSDAADKLSKQLEGVKKKLETEITPKLQSIANEAFITQRPEAKKDMVINGKKTIVSLISDGRVMIDFGVFDDANDMYQNMRFEEREKEINWHVTYYHNEVLKISNQYCELEDYLKLPFYKRIFKKRPV